MESETQPRRAQRTETPSKGDRRERDLLDAAGRFLADGTFGSASISDIAVEAGLSRASFYFYFGSKQALLATLVDDAVRKFNDQILEVVDDGRFATPADAVKATVHAAAELWWEHSRVLSASFELGAANSEVYERTMANFAIVAEPTLELLHRHGKVPEATDDTASAALVSALMLMTERNFFHLMTGSPAVEDRDALTRTLQSIWLRAFGLDDEPETPGR